MTSVEHDIAFIHAQDTRFSTITTDAVSWGMRLLGIGYHEPSARDARRRITAFFDRHLRTPIG